MRNRTKITTAKKKDIIPNKGELQQFNNFVLFQTENGKVNIDVYFQDETLWLTQKAIAELFEKGRSTITEHLRKIFEEDELDEQVVCRNFRHTTQHGAIEGLQQEKKVKFYNLKAITAVGYRQNSSRNHLHRSRCHQNIYMGLKTWKHAPNGKIVKNDVSIAKNYLNEEHIKALEQMVSGYLDVAETRTRNCQVMNMKDWDRFLVQFLELADYPILKDAGKTSMLQAKLKAESEYEKYRVIQDKLYESDFDKILKKLPRKN